MKGIDWKWDRILIALRVHFNLAISICSSEASGRLLIHRHYQQDYQRLRFVPRIVALVSILYVLHTLCIYFIHPFKTWFLSFVSLK